MHPHTIREKYIAFFTTHGHTEIPSARLVPENDPTTLFTGSGMQPLLPYLLGEPHPKGTRLVDSQKCFRSGDIEEVGDNRHTTFFEMLGNWSLGDYGKHEQLPWFFEFLTKEIGLDPKRLYVTVFAGDEALGIPRDDEAVTLWQSLFASVGIEAAAGYMGSEEEGAVRGIHPGERIFFYDAKKNWWSRSGVPSAMPAGEPGGPDSEVFYEFDIAHDPAYGAECHPNCDCGRFLEIGNSVFMQYKKNEDGTFSLLPKPNVDFGGGLERIAMAAQHTPDIVAVNHQPIIAYIERTTGKKYGADPKETKAFRVIADHMKAAVFLIADGVLPSNTDQGYFVRRLIRRAVRYADLLGMSESGFAEVVQPIVAMYETQYKPLRENQDVIVRAIEAEEKKFRETLQQGAKEIERKNKDLQIFVSEDIKIIDQIRTILDTHIPRMKMFDEGDEVPAHNRISGDTLFQLHSTFGFPAELSLEEFDRLRTQRALHPLSSERKDKLLSEYAEQMKKHQELSRAGSEQKFKGGLADASEITTMLHTCTHLMLAGLQKYLGKDVHQAGSNITSERARFDFTYHEKVPREILDQVEAYVNEAIQSGATMTTSVMAKEDARAAGVEGSFWEKYPDQVTVYTFEAPTGVQYSRELCGGPHVHRAADIQGTFRIKKEEASSAGVRRIKAVLE
jgi:alanyl-tRNA synthetase